MIVRSIWHYVIAAIIAAVLIVAILMVADNIGASWAGLIAALPLTVPLALVFLDDSQIGEFAFYASWGKLGYFAASLVLFAAVAYAGINKWWALLAFMITWFVITGVLFWYWIENPPSVLNIKED